MQSHSLVLGVTGQSFPPFHLHPDVWSVVAALVVSYWWALTRLGPRKVAPGEAVATRNQVICYISAVVTLWIFAEYPIHDLAEHYLFSVHMVQHLVFTTVSAPLMLMGLPPWLLRTLLVTPRRVYAVVRQLTRPVVALVIFNTFLVLTHWPAVVNETTHNELFHFGVHTIMFGTALILWLPMVNQLPELPRLTYPQRMVYLFLQSLVPTIPASFLTFSTGVVYKSYAHASTKLGISPVADQQVAGAVMKIGGGLILWGILGYTFFAWWAAEQRRDRMPDTLTWDDVARELERSRPPG
jgi:putative membrane protein